MTEIDEREHLADDIEVEINCNGSKVDHNQFLDEEV